MPSDTTHTGVFACPHCGLALERTDGAAACGNNHSFDRAREGYLNLLVGGRLPPGTTPGDTAESLAARRRFLSTGAYRPVADAVTRAIGAVDGPVLDVGCGEGWYLAQVPARERFGIDIAKKAVQMASRSVPGAAFAVATAFRLPVLDASCAAVFSVFAPHPFDEFARVLRDNGVWVTATPGPDHLRQMRPAYDPDDRANERFDRRTQPPAESSSAERVTFGLDLDEQSANDLFLMTPLQWQAGANRTTVRHVTVDVWVSRGVRDPRPAPVE
ncbi:MAG: rRNA ((745)-N(1))-methyltransferase [Actinomycetota bacterium]|jgi:23S rRNA (guanine745-N1)-methyltransferase